MSVLNIPWDDEGRLCLNTFKNIRNSLSIELRINPEVYDGILLEYDQSKAILPSYEVIIAEVQYETSDFSCSPLLHNSFLQYVLKIFNKANYSS